VGISILVGGLSFLPSFTYSSAITSSISLEQLYELSLLFSMMRLLLVIAFSNFSNYRSYFLSFNFDTLPLVVAALGDTTLLLDYLSSEPIFWVWP
jgi:hypothetical protein